MEAPKCPFCGDQMAKIVPIFFQGPDVTTFTCKNEACEKIVNINVVPKSAVAMKGEKL